MGFMTAFKAQSAMAAHRKGDYAKARKLYQEALDEGLLAAQPMLGYANILIRAGEYEKAKELLIKTQNAPGMRPDQKSQLFVDYAACCARTGQLDKGIALLEKQHNRLAIGATYQALGILYVEQLLPENKPVATEDTVVMVPGANEFADPVPAEGLTVEEKQTLLEKQWAEKLQKAAKFIDESIDYDDEDYVCMDNKGQFLYRVLGDTAGAKEWFVKANKLKPEQIDSLWFLSRYDLEEGNTAAAIEKLEDAQDGNFAPLNYVTRQMIADELARLRG